LKLTPKVKVDSIYLGVCDYIFEQKVIVVAPPVAYAGLDRSICGPGTLSIGSGNIPGYQYTWKKGSDTIARVSKPTLAISTTSDFDLIVVDSKGCKSTDAMRVAVGQPSTLAMTQTPGSCPSTLGKIQLISAPTADKFAVSIGTSFTGSNYATANTIDSLPFDIKTNIPLAGATYTFRLFNGADSCYFDTTVVVSPIVCITPGTLGNYVWYDANNNGNQDADELKVKDAIIELYRNGILVAKDTTDANGIYGFNNLDSASYHIKVVRSSLPSLWSISLKPNAIGVDDSLDTDVNPSSFVSQDVIIDPTPTPGISLHDNPTLDIGLRKLPTLAITDPCGCWDVNYKIKDSLELHEQIKVISGANENWKLIAQTGMWKVDSLGKINQPVPATLIESTPGNYTLDYLMEHNIPYTAKLTNGFDTLNYGGNCSSKYPTISLSLLDTAICFNADPIPLTAYTSNGTASFYYINNTNQQITITEFDPKLYAIGQNVNVYLRTQPSDPNMCPSTKYQKITISTTNCAVVCIIPSATFTQSAATCSTAGAPNNDGKISIATLANADKYGVSIGTTYTGPAYAAATAVGTPVFDIQTAIPNTGQTFTVRLFNGADGCSKDTTIVVGKTTCTIPCYIPSATFTQSAATCSSSGVPNNNGKISISTLTNTDKYGVSVGATYTGPAYATAIAVGIPTFDIQTGIPNTGQTYTVRLYNGANGCSKDTTIVVGKITCIVPPPACVLPSATFGQTAATCSTAGVPNNNGKISINALANADKYGISVGTTYTGPAYAAAIAVGTPTFDVQTTVPNAGQSYTIRLYNGNDGCSKDTTIVVGIVSCCNPNTSYQICPGESYTLTISDLTLTGIQWFKNGVAIPGATNLTYNVTSFGTYTYTASNSTGCTVNQCCPTVITANPNCCLPKVCLPVTIKVNGRL
jgi:hypothetical protein